MTAEQAPPGPAPAEGLPGAPTPPPTEWVLYVDLDAYYVSCERRDRPELAGRAVIVGPPPSEEPGRGVVLSASYEARAFGVHSAMPARVAARLCPDAVWVPPDFAKYERIALEVRELLRPHARSLVPYSIDECVLLVGAVPAEAARELAVRLQQELLGKLRLGASFGVATSRTVAKIASDRAKPGGVMLVPPAEVVTFLAPLPVRAIPGVGPRTEEVLARHGIKTIGELAAHRPTDLLRELGGFAKELIDLARGNPHEVPEDRTEPRSRSADHTLAEDAQSADEVVGVVRRLAGELARSLETEGLRYAAVVVAFRWSDFDRTQRGRSLSAAREGSEALVEEADRLARALWADERGRKRRGVRTISVRVERLSDRRQRQVSLDQYGSARPPRSG
ncbi:MAG TPA: DNA polymerase IV [Thermoplasmata archaeon]|nr:DNA polymerase IV [Thermoplasmata archaeon]